MSLSLKKNTSVFPWRIFSRVVGIQSSLVLLSLLASGLAARHFYKKQLFQDLEVRLKESLKIAAKQSSFPLPSNWCAELSKETSLRFTVVNEDGTLFCDSQIDPSTAQNHRDRSEIVEAKKNQFGFSSRLSESVKHELFYGAYYLAEKKIFLRAALPLKEYLATVQWFDTSFGFALLFFAVLFGGLTLWAGQKLVFPLGRMILRTQNLLDTNQPSLTTEEMMTDSFGEWSDLESNIEGLKRDLEAKTKTLDTERVELATILSSITDAILAVDTEGSALFYNSRLEILVGRQKEQVKLWEVFRDPDVLEAFQRALKEGKQGTTDTISLLANDGLKHFFSLSVSPLRDKDLKVYGAVGIFHDISELKTAEQMRIDFVANVSHELRTPLTSIKGYTETLQIDLDENRPVSKDFLSIISKNTNRLMNIMEDLLDLSSIESDQMIQKENLSTEDITVRIYKQMESKFQKKNQKVDFDFSASFVFADSKRLEQILTNLLDNAGKYTPENGTIRVAWVSDKDSIVLKVKDSGAGIPLEHQSRIFERFYRVDKARSREQGGTGLGLAIVKHIMQRHEGTVSVESSVGHGTTFSCRFPAA